MTKYIKMTVSSNFRNIFLCSLPEVSLLFSSNGSRSFKLCSILSMIFLVSPFLLTMWQGIPQENLVSRKQTPSCALWPGLVQFHQYLILLLHASLFPCCPNDFRSWLQPWADAAAFIMVFQTGWFIESMWSQTMVIHMLRSPAIQESSTFSVVVTTLAATFFVTSLPYSPLTILKLGRTKWIVLCSIVCYYVSLYA